MNLPSLFWHPSAPPYADAREQHIEHVEKLVLGLYAELAVIRSDLSVIRKELAFVAFSTNLIRHQEQIDMTTIKEALDEISAKADEEKTFIAGVGDRVQKIIDSETSDLSDEDATELSNIIAGLSDHETVLSNIAQTAATTDTSQATVNSTSPGGFNPSTPGGNVTTSSDPSQSVQTGSQTNMNAAANAPIVAGAPQSNPTSTPPAPTGSGNVQAIPTVLPPQPATGTPAPTITGIDPAAGLNGIGVTITGTALNEVTAVMFGTVAASTYNANSDDSISVTVPPQAGNAVNAQVDVTVQSAGGVSSPATFTYST